MFAYNHLYDNPIMMLAFIAAILGIMAKIYIYVTRPDIAMKEKEMEELAKQRRAERLGKAAKGAATLYKWLKK